MVLEDVRPGLFTVNLSVTCMHIVHTHTYPCEYIQGRLEVCLECSSSGTTWFFLRQESPPVAWGSLTVFASPALGFQA